jgi:hypothetical protein
LRKDKALGKSPFLFKQEQREFIFVREKTCGPFPPGRFDSLKKRRRKDKFACRDVRPDASQARLVKTAGWVHAPPRGMGKEYLFAGNFALEGPRFPGKTEKNAEGADQWQNNCIKNYK